MNRTDLLIERSLKSVYQQKNVNPKEIFIIDDNLKKDKNDKYSTEYHNIKWRVNSFRKEFFKIKFSDGKIPEGHFHTNILPNKRTHGNSGTGAWNTAIYQSLKYGRNNYIAILDDDDEWDENYLKRCLNKTKINRKKTNKEFVLAVISCILRREREKDIEMNINENNFNRNEFFIGNPGFQGSNMFIRLREFLMIGCFDESLKSTTDRDVAIRLIELKEMLEYPKFKFIKEPLVIHHADEENRVTNKYSNKKSGLDLFYRKYIHQMDNDVKEKSLERAKRYFNYNYSEVNQKNVSSSNFNEYNGKPFNLIIGVISSDLIVIKEFLKSFYQIFNTDLLKDYRIIILENTDDEYEIRPIISYFRNEKQINIELIDLNKQKELIKEYPFYYLFNEELINKKSIAFSRSLIQWILYNRSMDLYNGNSIVWIIDDDNMFNNLIYDEKQNKIEIKTRDFFSIISHFKHNGKMDAILGTVTDAPPLPFLSTLRTQALDLLFNLIWFSKQNPKNNFDRFIHHNFTFIENNRDFYYDLSSEYFEHLESPFWWYPIGRRCEKNYHAFNIFLEEIALINKGANIFRPIILNNYEWGKINGKSIYRGGNTIIYDLEMLRVPNIIPNISKGNKKLITRRSDFNWAIINKYMFNRNICEIKLPLRHHRRLQNSKVLANQEKLSRDIYGMVFYRTLEEILRENYEKDRTKILKKAVILFKKRYRDYINRIKVNLYRTEFLLKKAVKVLRDNKNWWYKNEYRIFMNDNIQNAIYSLESLSYEISKRKMQKYINSIKNADNLMNYEVYNDFINFLEDIKRKLLISNLLENNFEV